MAKQTMKKIALYTIGVVSGIAVSLSVQGFAAERQDKAADDGGIPVQSLRTMAEIYGQIKANYYEDKSDKDLLEGAMKGMVAGLDPHSEYLNGQDYEDMKEGINGEFGGLGMEVGSENGFVQVIAPIEDTPAYRAGIKSGDYIVQVDGVSTRGLSLSEVVKKMRGKPGTDVTLTISRKDTGKPITVKLTRAIIKVKSVRFKLLEPGYGYVRVSQFQPRTIGSLKDALVELHRENQGNLKGIILDLRDNPGGIIQGAVGVSAAFLPKDVTVVSTKGREEKTDMVLTASPAGYTLDGKDPLVGLPEEVKDVPLVVLINSGSASASEIVSGALQDYKRAVIVGTQSFGKGSVQTLLNLSGGGAIKITTALYYTPKDRSIQAKGIVPDVEVKDEKRTFESREADLAGHIGNPLGGQEVTGGATGNNADNAAASAEKAASDVEGKAGQGEEKESLLSSREPNPKKDVQLKAALDLVKDPQKWQQSLGLAAVKPDDGKDKRGKGGKK